MSLDNSPENEAARPILIVDDEEIVLVALRDTLLREGYSVVASPHAIHALSVLKKQEFSVVITDQQMPMVSGLEFLAQVRETQPDATRILITAVLSLSTVIDAINKGEIYRFVVKPWLREELLATVKNAVQRHQMISKNARLQAAAQTMNRQLQELNGALESQVARGAEQNAQLREFVRGEEENLRRAVELCLQTMRAFYPAAGAQARRVAALCRAMAAGSEMSSAHKQTLEISSYIYDIGLVGLPRPLIRRWREAPAGLSEPEWNLIHQHPVLGQEMAAFVRDLAGVGPAIRGHHERFDGAGYPDGLSGEKISWPSRLLAVAVARAESNLEPEPAAEMIRQGSGTAFAPEAVRLLLRTAPKAVAPVKKRAVPLAELRPGMVPWQDIYSEDGMLLIPDGQPLTAAGIDKLLNYNRINPISQPFLVCC